MIATVLMLSVLTLGLDASPRPLGELPTILQAQLHDGQQFRYRATFEIRDAQMPSRLDDSFTAVVTDLHGQALRWVQHYAAGPRTGMDIPFSIGTDGSFVNQTTNAASAEATFLYNRALFGDPTYSSHDVSDVTGTATFKSGIMTNLDFAASNGHDMPNGKRMSFAVKQTMELLR